eukprot:CAMPEP_0194540412 /NCGR_PEP_ID=MMETSP0253-20130528/80612_1 /TAXON_ID=2966 /ORGANISM="Noctiluca scintillans" /LENGTH=76 /DNA_ID=CAMNT_0039386781 /DNA_START=59 /DNA_END=286 /DNA_ORIENTATION=-
MGCLCGVPEDLRSTLTGCIKVYDLGGCPGKGRGSGRILMLKIQGFSETTAHTGMGPRAFPRNLLRSSVIPRFRTIF